MEEMKNNIKANVADKNIVALKDPVIVKVTIDLGLAVTTFLQIERNDIQLFKDTVGYPDFNKSEMEELKKSIDEKVGSMLIDGLNCEVKDFSAGYEFLEVEPDEQNRNHADS